ncbi:MAG: hypothetical protein HY721_17405 [Planctomycetes bacterium]|nr:hypothetical protein [Planctomycetota bacterium]
MLWFVEHLARELDVACAVKCLAEARFPVDVWIRNIYLHARDVLLGPPPDIVVHPFFYFADGALGTHHYVRAWPRALHLNLAWEELFYSANARIKGPSDDFARRRVLHHAWGESYRSFLVKHGVPPGHVFVNGNPACQLYVPPYSHILPGRSELAARHGIDPDATWVFIPENYRWAFTSENKLRKIAASAEHHGQLLEMKEHCIRSLEVLMGWCDRAAARGGAAMILRPRPATNTQHMLEFLERTVGRAASGFHVTKDGTVREWILSSDAVLSSFSTSLIEASIAGKPIYMIEPLPLPEGLSSSWYEHVERVRTEDGFQAAVALGARSENWRELSAWAHRELLSSGDPIDGLAQLIGRLAAPGQDLAPRPPRRGILGGVCDFVASRRARREGPSAIQINRDTHEGDEFTDEDVRARVARWGDVLLEGGAGATRPPRSVPGRCTPRACPPRT